MAGLVPAISALNSEMLMLKTDAVASESRDINFTDDVLIKAI